MGVFTGMDANHLRRALDDIFDDAVLFHGFTDYYRDYELVVYAGTHVTPPRHLRYLFRYCVEAQVTTALSAEIWRRSLDERLINPETGAGLDGHVWGVKWHCLYPGGRLVEGSTQAADWSEALGRPFHEVEIETNAHLLRLVFSDLEVTELTPGYAPFILRAT